jgi:type I restriction enzyme S subunit
MLDDMAGLIDALEEELAARKKQYEWSRESLLRIDDAEIMSLGEICDYSKKRISSSTLNTHTYTCVESMLQNKCGKVDAASVPECGNLIAYEKGDVLIGNIRPYLKKIWLADVDGGTNGDVLVVQRKEKNKISAEYLYYVLSSDEFFLYDMQYAKGAKMPRGDKVAIMKYPIPVPSINMQNKIVHTLDDMTALIDLLEEELAARKKQYEYYRDKLLTFKRKLEVA